MLVPIWGPQIQIPEITLEELEKKIDIWAGTIIPESDTETRTNLSLYFSKNRLCDKEERFLWFWKRNLLLYYPIYKNQMDMWKERMTYLWFYDNLKEHVTVYDGKIRLDEDIKKEIISTINKKIDDIYSGNIDTNRSFAGEANSVLHDEGEESNTYKDDKTDKGRGFNFQYPEANYQGGVIPYDLDNNPSVEFIDSQSDTVSKGSLVHTGSSDFSNDGTRKDNTTNTETTDTDTSSTNNRTETQNQDKNEDQNRGSNKKEDWTKTVNIESDSINDLAEKLIVQLPFTDFFKQFVDKMSICFRQVYIDGEEKFYYEAF